MFGIPKQLADLVPMFSRHITEISRIANAIVKSIWEEHGHRLENLESTWIDPEEFAAAVEAKGCPLDNVWGFIDRTLYGMYKPSEFQELYFSDHKWKHGLKYQSILCPNGMIAHCASPIEGRHHNSYMYFLSGVDTTLLQISGDNGREMAIFGDTAYGLHCYLLKPFKGNNLTPGQVEFNARTSVVRQSVEWGFGKVISLFAFLNFVKNPAATCRVLQSQCIAHKCTHLFVWITNQRFLWSRSSTSAGLFCLNYLNSNVMPETGALTDVFYTQTKSRFIQPGVVMPEFLMQLLSFHIFSLFTEQNKSKLQTNVLLVVSPGQLIAKRVIQRRQIR